MEKILHLEPGEAAKVLRSLSTELAELVSRPVLISMKGHPCTGRRLVAFSLAVTLRCMLIKEENIIASRMPLITSIEKANQVSYDVVCQIAASQLQCGLSVVIDSVISDHSHFNQLQQLAKSNATPLLVVECKAQDASMLWRSLDKLESATFLNCWWDKPSSLEDLQQLLSSQSDCYNVGEIPTLIVDLLPSWDIKKCLSDLIRSISDFVHQAKSLHNFTFRDKWDYDNATCDQCLKPISGSVYTCSDCNFIFHRSCAKLPEKLESQYLIPLYLKNAAEQGRDSRCTCCKSLINGYFYTDQKSEVLFDLNCIFLPSYRRVKIHEHVFELSFTFEDYTCGVCGIHSDQKIYYVCYECALRIDPHCALLPETVLFERHRHPFELSISPRDDYHVGYYCDVCQETRDPNHWIYYCAECDYPVHTSCLVPKALAPLSESLLFNSHEGSKG